MSKRLLLLITSAFPVTAAAWSADVENDKTHREPGGVYGIYQFITVSTTRPDQVGSHICAGDVAVFVPTLRSRIDGLTNSGLRELWRLSNYRTNALPNIWIPEKTPPRTLNLHEYEKFSVTEAGFSIRNFIARFGLPSRYLAGQWNKGQIDRIEGHVPVRDDSGLLQGPDFLIYDLPSGHSVAVYVPKPPATNFTTASIVDSKGDLLIPNMVELLIPQAPKPRKLTAQPDGKLTAPLVGGGAETIGTWSLRDHQLIITTILSNSDAVLSQDSIWLGGVEYIADILVNEHEIICDPVTGQGGSSHGDK